MELNTYSADAVGAIVVGDMNAHNESWLLHSSGNTPECNELFNVCSRMGLIEKVNKHTRGKYLLDLFLTDIPVGVTCKFLPRISDHNPVLSSISIEVKRSLAHAREFGLFEI